MNKNERKSSFLEGNLSIAPTVKAATYTAPDIEIVEIETEQNIFAGSGDLPGMPGEPW